jgi:SNF2 family DNA or RNA helicase
VQESNELESSKIVVFDNRLKRIFFSYDYPNKFIKLSSLELFNLLVYKRNVKEIAYQDLCIEQDILNLEIIKSLNDIFLIIDIKAEYSFITCSLNSVFIERIISLKDLQYILDNKYLICNNQLISVSDDSISFSEKILKNVIDSNKLPILYSLELFSNRDDSSFLKFAQQEINFQEILNCELYSGNSSLFIRELYSYQKDGLKWLQYCCLNRIGGILGDDMGLGKTAQVIALIAWAVERKVLSNILIVVPNTLLVNWIREFQFFAPSLIPYIHHGALRTGSVDLLLGEDIIVTTYSMIVNDQYLFNKIKWGAIILDEASLIKNPLSERKISLSDLDSNIKIAMTGTPVENSLTDLWSISDFVLPGYLGTLKSFSSKYIRRNIEQTINEANLIALRKDVSFIMLRRKKEDVLDSLPEKIDIHQALQMNLNEASLYDSERESILSKVDKEKSSNVLTLIQNLRQYTTHPLLFESDRLLQSTIKTLMILSSKFSRTIEIVNEIKLKKEKVLIFTEYLKMIDTFKRVFEEYYQTDVFTIDGRVDTPERQKRIDLFSKEEGFGIMILNPKTAGMGLNITAANHVIHYTRQWNPALEEQASARSYRNKQKKNVNIYYLYYVNTIEELIDSRLKEKSTLSGEIITTTDCEIPFDQYINSLSKSPITR